MFQWLDSSLYSGLPYAIVTLSFVLTFHYLRFPDVTSASSFVLGGALSALCVVHCELNPWLSVFVGAIGGAIAGGLTSFLHLAFKIEKIVAGILSAFAIYSVNLLILKPTISYGNRETILSFVEQYDRYWTGESKIALHAASIVLLFVLIVGIKLVLDWLLVSEFGLSIRSMEDEDNGKRVLQESGSSASKPLVIGLVAGNSLVAFAGSVVSMIEGAASAHRGFDILITGILSFLIGKKCKDAVDWIFRKSTVVRPRLRLTTAAIIGPIVYFCIINASYRINIRSEFVKIAIATYVAFAISDKAFVARLARLSKKLLSPKTCKSSEGLLVVNKLTFRYGQCELPTISKLELVLPEAAVVLLQSGVGSGKSTLLKLLSGKLSPDEGRIVIEGEDLTENASRRSKVVAFMNQDARRNFVNKLTIAENLAVANVGARPSFLRYFLPNKRMLLFSQIIKECSLPTRILDVLPDQVSGGQRQVLSIIKLFARPFLPRIVLLDEPFNNLDSANVKICIGLIHRLKEMGCLVIVVSHSHTADLRADSVFAITHGRFVTTSVPDDILKNPDFITY